MRLTGSVPSLAALLTLVCGTACTPLPQFPFAEGADLAPPGIVELGFQSATQLIVGFDEPCNLVANSLLPGETLNQTEVTVARAETSALGGRTPGGLATGGLASNGQAPGSEEGPVTHQLLFTFSTPPDPATEHSIEAQVADAAGNNLRFVARFFGLNQLVPAMIINEFTSQGSGSHPDLVEIRILSDGNLAGSCIYEGVPGNWNQKLVFPDLAVNEGDYVVVHFKPQGLPEEINELVRKDESGGYDANPQAWDFWVADGSGLSGNNGVLTLCENPIGGIIDGVLYSNRTSESDDSYRGFGSTTMVERADYLVAEGGWHADGQVRPEDAIDPEDSTATRSMSRESTGVDTNRREDWHITPTRGLTAGGENSDDVYVPN